MAPVPVAPKVPDVTPARQFGPAPQRLSLRRSDSELLTCFYEDTSSVRDETRMLETSGKAECSQRRIPEGSQFDASKPNRQREQTRLSIYSWNPGPRRGTPGAIEDHIAGKWHIIALQEAIEYLQHECLTNHFFITHFAGCAVLFNKDTFHSDVQGQLAYVHDVKKCPFFVEEGQVGWVLQGVISPARFRRTPRRGKPHFTMMSLHFHNVNAKNFGDQRR